jgi:glutathione peroxidase
MSLQDLPIHRLDGAAGILRDLTGGRAALLVNVASRCGLTPQYAGLERVHEAFAGRGVAVVGLPCNQFGGQEPGSAEEIAQFCSTSYGVSFPLTEKISVNGPDRHPLYDAITEAPDEAGRTGDISWNFEKAVMDAEGRIVARFSPRVDPEDSRIAVVLEQVAAPA